MNESTYIDRRAEFMLDPAVRHLNHGSFGTVPRSVYFHHEAVRRRIEENPDRFFGRDLAAETDLVRAEAARFLGAPAERLSLTDNVTEGISAVLQSLALHRGEVIICTDHAYAAVETAIDNVCEKTGAHKIVAHIPLEATADDVAEIIGSQVDERTRLVVVEHITSSTARVFPAHDILARIRDSGVPVLIDGAHVPGMLPIHLDELRPDFWVGNFHKWAFAPRGAAGLYASERFADILRPAIYSYALRDDFTGRFLWQGTRDYSGRLCIGAGIEYLRSIGFDSYNDNNRRLAEFGAGIVSEALSAHAIAPSGVSMGLVSLPDGMITSRPAARRFAELIARNLQTEVAVSCWNGRGFLRLSAQIYNSPEEYEALAHELPKLIEDST